MPATLLEPTTHLAPERRTASTASLRIERRAGAEGDAPPAVVGHAAVFDSWTTLYESPRLLWREVVRPGAFAAALREKQDVRALFNHDENLILGRTRSGTLELSEDGTGLLSRTEPPDTDYARNLLVSIERGDVSGMSFAFTVRSGETKVVTQAEDETVVEDGGQRVTTRREGDRTIEERELLSLNLLDVSPVVYPAYDATDVALRALGERRERELPTQGGRTRRRLHRAGMRLRLLEAGRY
jgi:HK97 family phage prohead protease